MKYYLVWFEGRTTSVVVEATSRQQAIRKARAKPVAGRDKPVTAAREATAKEDALIRRGPGKDGKPTWIRTRPDGKSPEESHMKSKFRPHLTRNM